MDQIQNDMADLITAFKSLSYYQHFVKIKNARLQDEDYLQMKKDLERAKKQIKALAHEPAKIAEHLEKTQKLNAQFSEHPLNVNYQIYFLKIAELIDPLFDIFSL